MNKRLFLFLVGLILTSHVGQAQSKFKDFSTVDGVVFSTRWTHEKWLSKKSPLILSVKVKNTNSHAVSYTLGVEFFLNARMVEQNPAAEYCLKAGRTAKGKLNGTYFKPENLTEQEVRSDWFEFQLSGLEVSKVETCESK